MVFLDWNKERYDWYNSDPNDDAGTAEVNTSPLNELPDKKPETDLEIDTNDTSVVTPEIDQSDVERIYEVTTKIVLIPEGNHGRSVGVATLVYEAPFGGVNTIDFSQECISPKTE